MSPEALEILTPFFRVFLLVAGPVALVVTIYYLVLERRESKEAERLYRQVQATLKQHRSIERRRRRLDPHAPRYRDLPSSRGKV